MVAKYVVMFPVRVAVETVRAQHCLTCAHDGHTLMDTYAIVSGSTLLNQLVETVLSALGQPQLAVHSRGLVQVNNWKALPFESITDNQDQPVEALFKDISGHITLRILTKPASTDSQSSQCITDLKNRLLKAACSKQPQLLATVDNQQIKDIISQIIAGDEPSMLNHEQINAINDWLDQLEVQEERRSPVSSMKFNQLFEIPKLEKWFRADANPSRQKLLSFMNILNASAFRRNHPKIGYQQICNWFSNQRATNRRPALGTQQNNMQTQVPLSLLPDFRNKFDYTSIIENANKINENEMRIEGGSDSPVPTDEHSVHSSENGKNIEDFELKQESTASSPDLPMNMSASIASASPKHGTDLTSLSSLSNLSCVLAAQQQMQQHMGQQSGCSTPASNQNNGISRSRLMFDPLTELPVLEKWFEENPHPTWMQIDQYTQTLNSCPYRENYPPISTHNVKIWFKNRRAKCKRMQTGVVGMVDQKPMIEKLFAQV